MNITNIKAFQIYDSRGYPTIACMVEVENKYREISMIPSGASTGEKEAIELRDNASSWNGKGVKKAIDNINNIIAPKIIGMNVFDQEIIDNLMITMDGSENKKVLGANAILAVSLAVCKTAALAKNLPLYKYIRNKLTKIQEYIYNSPIPVVNVINGGKHANNNLDFQEFMFVPLKPNTWEECLKIADECFLSLQTILSDKKISTAKGDEGGFSVNFESIHEVFELLSNAIKKAGYVVGEDVGFGIDVAASEFYENGKYNLNIINKSLNSEELLNFYLDLINKYPIVYLEDPFDENDWTYFAKITEYLANKTLIVGDDLYCTNEKLFMNGVNSNATNSVLIKLNQIGTLSECLKTIQLASDNKFNFIISHRSGETEDTFIADLSLATNSKLIKTGSMSRSERLAKYNRITIIDETIEHLKQSKWEEICPKWK